MNGKGNQRTPFWKSLSKLDWVALVVTLLGIWAWWSGSPLQGHPGILLLRLLSMPALLYLAYRFWSRWRTELLWSLRNRLIVSYLFIAVVPVILLVVLANMAGEILYSQFAAYLLNHDIQDRIVLLADSSAHIAAAEAARPQSINREVLQKARKDQIKITEGLGFPDLKVDFDADPGYFRAIAGKNAHSFSGPVQTGNQLYLVSLSEVALPQGTRFIALSVPVQPEFLERLLPDLGPVDMTLWEKGEGETGQTALPIGNYRYHAIRRVMTLKRATLVASSWLDPVVDGFSQLEATYLSADGSAERGHPVFAFVKARRSQLNHRIFATLGELSAAKGYGTLLVTLLAFLLIEIAALITGIVVTRAITRTVADLYRATQFVQEGNFSHKVRVERKDQLGVLGDSFNSMTSSITNLIDEQKQLQRLENEISIAREVQDQLFPRNLPHVAGVEIEAICRAARSVSGDYYDFIQLSPTHVAIAIADISGKGISAALLMASLQAALRSQLLVPGSETLSTAELVARLNKHLVRNTGDDRFATFLVAIFDTATRTLRYTNAGHLPGFCLSDGKSIHLDQGGIVLGIVENYHYVEGIVQVPPDSVLIGYSDGLVEPENAYGEEFGVSRLEAAAQRVRHARPRHIAESLMTAAEEWSGSPEQADDMTVIVARLG
jgi:sigma-B regulation protein RsbU (phosphoserine phosphatase)